MRKVMIAGWALMVLSALSARAEGQMSLTLGETQPQSDYTSPYEMMTGVKYESEELPSVTLYFGYMYDENTGNPAIGNDLSLKQGSTAIGGHSIAGYVSYHF